MPWEYIALWLDTVRFRFLENAFKMSPASFSISGVGDEMYPASFFIDVSENEKFPASFSLSANEKGHFFLRRVVPDVASSPIPLARAKSPHGGVSGHGAEAEGDVRHRCVDADAESNRLHER